MKTKTLKKSTLSLLFLIAALLTVNAQNAI